MGKTVLKDAHSAAGRSAKIIMAARLAVIALFFASGVLTASFESRLVVVREQLGLNPSQMGFILLFWSVGSICIMPFAGRLVGRLGTRLTLTAGFLLSFASLAGVGLLVQGHYIIGVGVLLYAMGMGSGLTDVTFNLAGSRVELAMGRSVMPQFHAGFSLGTVVGAAIGAFVSRLSLPLLLHYSVVAVFGFALVMISLPFLLPDRSTDPGSTAESDQAVVTESSTAPGPAVEPSRTQSARSQSSESARSAGLSWTTASATLAGPAVDSATASDNSIAASNRPAATADNPAADPASSPVKSAWLEPRTLGIGLVMLSVTFAEGSANDWIASGIVQSFQASEAQAILVLDAFLVALTLMRLLGTRLIDRRGRVWTLRLSAVCLIVGLSCFGLAPWLPLSLAGALVWGAGAALGFPIGISAAGDDPDQAPLRVSVVSTIAYAAFFLGPPLLGLLAGFVGFRHALLAILAPAVLTFVLAPVVRPLSAVGSRTQPPRTQGMTSTYPTTEGMARTQPPYTRNDDIRCTSQRRRINVTPVHKE